MANTQSNYLNMLGKIKQIHQIPPFFLSIPNIILFSHIYRWNFNSSSIFEWWYIYVYKFWHTHIYMYSFCENTNPQQKSKAKQKEKGHLLQQCFCFKIKK